MINGVIDFSANNKFVVFLLTAIAALIGWWSVRQIPLDAIPDISDTQVIVYSHWDRSPDVIEDQVTYPIVTAMLGAPRVKAVRGFSDFGYSYVYVIFDDGTDMYWARSRILERLAMALPALPQGVRTELGPAATGLGWVFQYALVDASGQLSLADLRSYQDWFVRYHLRAVPGVAEIAPIGGFSRQYQVNVDPNRLSAYGIPISRVVEAVRGANNDASGRVIEFGGTEYMIRGRGYLGSTRDLENIVLSASDTATPIRIHDIGRVAMGPDIRRGVSDLNGTGEVVSGIVVMRQGENALDVIRRVKAKITQIEPALPRGVRILPVYDRSELIERTGNNLKSTLIEIIITVSLVTLVFLWHVPSAIIPIVTMPVAVLIAFVPLSLLGFSANIMSLAGIAIAAGVLVDAAIVVVEQTHKRLEESRRRDPLADCHSIVLAAVKSVAAPSFFALLVIAVSFLPVFTLEDQEGRLFRPLACATSLAVMVAAVLAITLDPALRLLMTRMKPLVFRPRWLCRVASLALVGGVHAEEKHPVIRLLMRVYEPLVKWALDRKWTVICMACALMLITIPAYQRLGGEFMPPLDEGTLLYMPSTMPGISVGEAQKLLQVTDRIIKQFPEVDTVMGKAGRAETSTDPAPLSMLETIITLKPKSQWRKTGTWYSSWAPEWSKAFLQRITPDHISRQDLVNELNASLAIPGVANAWTMPIKARIDMLATGMRTPAGLKISGSDLHAIEHIGAQIESLLTSVPGTRGVFAERPATGFFLDIEWNRAALARYGVSIEEAQTAVAHSIGGENVTTTIEGRERYAVNVRYLRDFRSNYATLGRVLVPTSGGQRHIPLAQLADIKSSSGPSMIRNEDGLLTGYVYVDMGARDPESYVREADRLLRDKVNLPPGYAVAWSGEYGSMQRVKSRLQFIVPLTLLMIVLLLYLNTRSVAKTCIVALAVPFSAIGAVWFLYLLDYNMSIGVWVGLIALLGIDAATGVFMLLYLDQAFDKARREGRLRTLADLQRAIVEGAARRLRPKFMTATTMLFGLAPIMFGAGTGSDVMKRIAAPLLGGILTSFVLELIVYPPIYQAWKWREVKRHARADVPGEPSASTN